MNKMITSSEVAKRYGKSLRKVLYATRKGLFKAEKVGWSWLYSINKLPKEWPARKYEVKGKGEDTIETSQI